MRDWCRSSSQRYQFHGRTQSWRSCLLTTGLLCWRCAQGVWADSTWWSCAWLASEREENEIWWPNRRSFDPFPADVDRIDNAGVKLLGAPIGTKAFTSDFVQKKLDALNAVYKLLREVNNAQVEFALFRGRLAYRERVFGQSLYLFEVAARWYFSEISLTRFLCFFVWPNISFAFFASCFCERALWRELYTRIEFRPLLSPSSENALRSSGLERNKASWHSVESFCSHPTGKTKCVTHQ